MKRYAYAALILGSFLAASGCLTAESKLDAKGAGSMTLTYTLGPGGLEAEKKKIEGPHVKVVSAEHKDSHGIFKITFDDAQKLNTSTFFENVAVTIADVGGNKEVTTTIVNKKPQKFADDVLDKIGREVRISVELPGDVVTSNAQTTKGAVVTWSFPTNDFTNQPQVVLKATYKNPSPAG
jgi:hypothetical protein